MKSMTMAGIAVLVMSNPLMAQDRTEVIERIKPVGQVAVEGQAQSAATSTAAATPTAAAPAAPADPAEALYTAKGCTACHGAQGKAPIMSTYPKVAALPEQYILNQLKDIKSGARNNGQSAVMKGIMAAVSEEDMKVLAAWLSSLPRGEAAPAAAAPPAAPATAAPAPAAAAPAPSADPGAALYAAKGCAACHGADGKTPIMSTYPKVAALPEQYIFNQMKDIKSGARNNGQTAAMKGIMASVSEEDMKAISGWLSQQPR
ncbi:c-type cytochrome [Sedimenticola selenatireducens]|uniref:c-type cytochrome n=1 Tax=Sedimenticola selenatireducens TaxID=191960 RepID=UPI002AAB59BD|nr:c-type cytochrome [Sedimenticola selenatireducens]